MTRAEWLRQEISLYKEELESPVHPMRRHAIEEIMESHWAELAALKNTKWDPIPPHAVKIAGSWALPERLTEIDGKPYVRCEDHGLIPADHDCGATYGDHLCIVSAHPNHRVGEDHDDQFTPYREWMNQLHDRVRAVIDLHSQNEGPGGLTSGCCAECGHEWPCPTVHVAKGWGEIYDCWNAGWCHHAGVKLTDPMPDIVAALQDDSDFDDVNVDDDLPDT